MRLNFAAVVPVFNPEPGLLPLCGDLLRSFDTVVVVDDGSVRAREMFVRLPEGVVRLSHPVNRGKGAAMKTALSWLATHRANLWGVVFADGDGQHRVSDVVAVASLGAKTDRVVFGVRDFSRKGVPFRSWWGNRWTSIEVWLLFRIWLPDTQTGLRTLPRRLWEPFAVLHGSRFEYESRWFRALAERGERILTHPVETVYRAGNRASSFRPLRDTLLTQRALISYTQT